MAKIYNTNSNTLLSGSSGNDTIKNGGEDFSGYWHEGGSKITISAGKGNDYIDNTQNGDYSSINGGAGNDSLWGNSGNDTFIYRADEGTERIFDYSSGDMLKILNSSGSTGKFTKSKFSSGTLSLTISGGGQVIFNDVAKGDTFNINGTGYKISGSKLVKK